jgi:uncharacterized integral membrane protein (TIGR00697 family)
MTNEILFFLHILLNIGFVLGAVRLGSQALTVMAALQAVLANLFVVKQMNLFGFTVTCSDVFAIGGILSLNLLQEHYGRESAQKAVRITLLCLVFFVAMSFMHLGYAPSSLDETQEAYRKLLSPQLRIVLASIGAYYIVQKLDVALFGSLKALFGGRNLGLRVGLSLTIAQFLDTVLFSYLGLYGLVQSLFDVIAVSFAVKCAIIACGAPLSALSRRFYRAPV